MNKLRKQYVKNIVVNVFFSLYISTNILIMLFSPFRRCIIINVADIFVAIELILFSYKINENKFTKGQQKKK